MPSLAAVTKSLPATERRAATVAAFIALAATRNPSEISTTAIAEHMGLTQGALFKHFPTKEALLVSVMEWVHHTLTTRLADAERSTAEPLDGLQRMFLAHAAFAVEYPGVPRIVFGELQRDAGGAPRAVIQSMQADYGERVRRLLMAAQHAGRIAPDVDLSGAVTLYIGSIQGLVFQSLMSGDPSHLTRSAPGVFTLFRRALEFEQ